MEFLYVLEDVRMPVLNEFMLAVTTLGEETVFLIIALILFWCVDKYIGYYTLSVGFIGTVCNQFLKLLFRIPRPWILDTNFTILEQAREAAGGYSFPSGHTQSAVGTFGSMAYIFKNRVIRVFTIMIAALVAFSRMYIGVHTPMDVLASVIIAVALIIGLKPVVISDDHKRFPLLLVGMTVLALAFLCFVHFYNFPTDIDPYNYSSGLKNAYTLFGSLFGLLVVYIADENWLKFPTTAVWWAQIIKVVIGLGLVLLVKSGTKELLNHIFGEQFGRSVRYCLIVLTAGVLWPLSFKWFSRLGYKG